MNQHSPKIVLLGAGSVSFGSGAIADLFLTEELRGSTLALVDIDAEALERAGKLAEAVNIYSGANFKVETYKSHVDAFPGANFVVNCTVIERNKYWKQDFLVPKKWGVRHTLGENGGPGGLFFTLRTIPMVMDFIRAMERICKDAYFINFSNPESRIILAINRYSGIRAIGLCHGLFMGRWAVTHILGREQGSVEVAGAGLNHFQWLTNVFDPSTGEDLYPKLREAERGFNPEFAPLSRKLFGAFGLYPTCSDDHMGEYVAYGWEAGEEGYDFSWDEQERVKRKEYLDGVITGKVPMAEFLKASGEQAAPVIKGIWHDQRSFIQAGVVYNQGAISNLPDDAAVEVPVALSASGIQPLAVGSLPEPAARMLRMQVSVQQTAVEAAINGSKEIAMQALLMDPVIHSTAAAKGLLDELWRINEPFIRKCI